MASVETQLTTANNALISLAQAAGRRAGRIGDATPHRKDAAVDTESLHLHQIHYEMHQDSKWL
jgi:hypothetical protein